MESKFVERLVEVLKEEGFAVVEERANDHAFTASARKGDTRVVVHATDREFQPMAALPKATSLAPSEIHMRAGLPPGVLGPVQVTAGFAGAGGETTSRAARKGGTRSVG